MGKGRMIGIGGAVAVAIGILVAVAATRGVFKPGGQAQAKAPAAAAAASAASAPLVFRGNEVVQPTLVALPQVVSFSGPLVAPNTAVLRAHAGGTLLQLRVAEGDRVAAGQPVGRIDMAELASRIAERTAQLDATRAALLQAERSHASNERLAAQEFISASALDSSRATLDSARANAQAARAALETTRVGQRDAQLLAPIAGIVAKRHVLPGEKVSAEQQVLTLVDLRQLELAGSVGTHEVARLSPGMAVQVQVEGVAEPVAARLLRIAPAAEAGTRSIGVTVGPAQPGRAAARRPVCGGAGDAGRPAAAPGAAGQRRGLHRRPAARVGDRRRQAAAPRRHAGPARRGRRPRGGAHRPGPPGPGAGRTL